MRTRATTEVATLPAGEESRLWLTNTPGKVEIIPTSAYAYNSREAIIRDELVKFRCTGNCGHTQTVRNYFSTGMVIGPWSQGGITYRSTISASFLARTRLLPFGAGVLEPTVPIGTFDWKQASYQAVSRMRPTVSDGLLFPNFAAELAETGVGVAEFVKNSAARRLRAERERLKAFRRGDASASSGTFWEKSVGTIKKVARKAAWANLAYQFAVRPTVSDAMKAIKTLQSYKQSLSRLINEAGQSQRRHYSRPVDNHVTLPADIFIDPGSSAFGATSTTIRRMEWVTRPKYCASMYFTYDTSALRGNFGRINYLLNAFGINRPASILWEAIPYSFVVDWFVNVGDVIGSVEDAIANPLPIVIHDFSESLKWEYRTRAEWRLDNVYKCDIAQVSVKSYSRNRSIPSTYDRLSVRTPSLNQVGLGASLITVRMD